MNGVIFEMQSTNEAEGDFTMCEVEEQQAARVEVQGSKRRAVIRVESEETQKYVRERFTHEVFIQEEVDEIGRVLGKASKRNSGKKGKFSEWA